MNIDIEKKQINRKILNLKDDWVIKAIRKLLDLDIEDVSDEHKLILNERIAVYEAKPDDVIDWETLKAELLKD